MKKEKIIILCHGTWGKYLLQDVKEHFGLFGLYEVLPFEENMSITAYRENIIKKMNNFNVLLLTDLFPGSTSNIAIHVGLSENVQALYGLSLKTILTIDSLWKEEGFSTLAKRCVEVNNVACIDLISDFNKCQERENYNG